MIVNSAAKPQQHARLPFEETVYIVLQDFADLGLAYRETDVERADLESVIADMIGGQFDRPIQVVAFNIAEGWVRDVSRDIAAEIRSRLLRDELRLADGVACFVERAVSQGFDPWSTSCADFPKEHWQLAP